MSIFTARADRVLVRTLILLAVVSAQASAQTMSGDAREVGLAGFAHASHLFRDPDAQEMQFVVPLGLLQAIGNRNVLRPGSGEFDPTMALEHAAVPTHYVIGRQSSPARARFIADIRQAGLHPDLSTYRGFTPAATLDGAGLLSPTWGRAFTVHGRATGFTHKVFVGAGPYLALQTSALFDQRLVTILGASSAEYSPNSSLEIGNQSTGQAAVQITGGYRGQLAINGNGVRLGYLEFQADYNHLRGFRYEDIDLNLRLDTNGEGLVALDPSRGAPLAIDRRFSSRGTGFAVDLATTAAFHRWRFSVRADAIGNRIDWKNVTHREYELARLTGGTSRVAAVLTEEAADVRQRLPVATRVQGAYVGDRWKGLAEVQQGFQGTTAAAALQRQFSAVELRGGARLVDRVVLPAAGVSVRAGRAWFDLGAAISTANIERERNVIVASSVRFVLGTRAGAPVQ
jgi:hypothetical protein